MPEVLALTREALRIACVYLTNAGYCPDENSWGMKIAIAKDCGKNMKCWDCWMEYLIEKADERIKERK